jgi:hypothetical protein
VSLRDYINIALSDLIVKVFFTTYKSRKFIPREEPLLSTYMCRFSGANLLSNYYILKATYYTYIKEVNKTTKDAFEEHLLLLELLYSYYIQGPLKLVNPKLCGFSSFKTHYN